MRRILNHCNNSLVSLTEDEYYILPEPKFQNFRSLHSTRNFHRVFQGTSKRDVRSTFSKSSFANIKQIPKSITCKSNERKLLQRRQRHRSSSSDNSKSSLVVLYRGAGDEVASSCCGSWSNRKFCVNSTFESERSRSIATQAFQRSTSKASTIVQQRKERKSKSNQISPSANTIISDDRLRARGVEQPPVRRVFSKLIERDDVHSKVERNNYGRNWRRFCPKQPIVNPRTKEQTKYHTGFKKEPCPRIFDFSAGYSKLMAQRPKSEDFNLNLGILMEHIHGKNSKGTGDNSSSLAAVDSQRIFPFQPSTSGNLKIVPNQVVFESKKVSVVVAEPRHAKVTVKAKQSCVDQAIMRQQHHQQKELVDLPLGVTTATINRFQIQRKPRDTAELVSTECNPRTQPYNRIRGQQRIDIHESPNCQSLPHHKSVVNDVPLSTLGFTFDQPIDWKNITLPEKTDLYQELSRRITSYKNADCIVRIGNDEFHCHLLVLQSYSSFFDNKNIKEIELAENSVTSRAFSLIYDWMISPTSESCYLLRRDNILEMFLAAQYLDIKELEEQCWAFIDNDELFSEDTAFLLYLEARKIGNNAVMELMLPRIMNFFLMLVSTKDFLELSVEELCLLLRSNYICVNSEMEVLMSAVRWLMHNWENRKQYLLEVLKCVRFGLIAPWQLVDVKRNPENPEFMELMSYPEIQKMVDDGLAFVIIKYWYGNRTEDYYHWIDLLGLTEPTNRNWAGEDKNYLTYKEFLLYLEEFQKTKLLEFKCRKSCVKPSPPNSPPKEDAQSSTIHTNYQIPKVAMNNSSETSNDISRTLTASMMMPPEVLNQYLNNIDKNGNKPMSKLTNGFLRSRN